MKSGVKVSGIDIDQIRTKNTVQDGIKRDVAHDWLTPEERTARIIGGLRDLRVRYVIYEPGNGTRYELVIVPLAELTGDGTRQYLVTLMNFGKSMRAGLGGEEHPSFIKEKLEVSNASAIALAELFEYLTTGKNVRYGLDQQYD